VKKLKVPEFVREHLLAFGVAVAAGITLTVIGFGSGGGGGGPDTSTGENHGSAWSYGERSNVLFRVENDARHGVWALISPVMEEFSSQDERPVNGARWLPNSKGVIVVCAREGTPYNVKLNGAFQRWRWYAELANGDWFPMAGFQETTEDGAQHLRGC
jgi:hypothetical protein